MIYVTLLVLVAQRIIRVYSRDRSPLNIMALMLFAMWIIDSIGLAPSTGKAMLFEFNE